SSHHLRDAARVIAVCLIDLCLQCRPHVPRLNAHHRRARFGENAVKPLRQRSGFQPNSLEAIDGVRQRRQQGFRLTCHPRFLHDLARIIHDADARFLDRHIESNKIGHAALLLLMLEAADAALVSPSASSAAPYFSAIHKPAGRLLLTARGAATAASTLGADSCYSYSFGRSAGAALSPSWWFHSYLVTRARIQDFRVKSITSLHIVVQPAFSGWGIR